MAWWYHAASFLYLCGLTLTLGAAAGGRLFPHLPASVGVAAPLVLLAGVGARLLAQVQMAFGEAGGITAASIRTVLFDMPWGRGWRWQAAAALAVAVAAIATRRRAASVFLLPLALGAAAAAALTGHAGAFPERAWIMVPIHAVHVAAAGLWMGTLAMLMWTVGRTLVCEPAGAPRRAALAGAVERFSPVAVMAVAVAALSGALAAVAHVASWDNLTSTSYGRTLLLKVGMFVLAGLCGAWNWRRVAPALPTDDVAAGQLRRVGGLELTLGLVILALTSLLAALPMPAESFVEEE